MSRRKQSQSPWAPVVAVVASALVLVATSPHQLVSGQFLQPQSHLGRLVQSITSPLVLSGGSSGDDSSPAGYYGGSDESAGDAQPVGPYGSGAQPARHAQASQQQASPSQHRAVPQQYYQAQADYAAGRRPQQQQPYQHQHQDEDQGAPSNARPNQQEYQMGTYLGPTMDDKEINGAFNSNDERDEDDGPAGYDGDFGGQPRQRAASSAYADQSGAYGGASGYAGRPLPDGPSPAEVGGGAGAYDEDGADEDEGPAAGAAQARGRGGGHQRRGMTRAASQFRQQPARYQGGGNMVAAANGYAPYGAGPIDLSGLMAGLAGNPNSGYDVYSGDGTPFAGGAGYGPGQDGRQGRRNQAASAQQSGYYGNPDLYGPNQPRGQQPANSNDDDHDDDMNDD